MEFSPAWGMQLIQHMNLIPARELRKPPHERLTRLGWLIMHAERYNNKLHYYIREQTNKTNTVKNIHYNWSMNSHMYTQHVCMCACVCMYVRMYIHTGMHMYVCTYVCMYVYTYARMHVCTCIHMYVCMYVCMCSTAYSMYAHSACLYV